MIIVRMQGIALDISLQSMSFNEVHIKIPTMINAGAVAAEGTLKNKGERNGAAKKQIATTRAVKPVLPPALTPAALSAYVVVFDVPNSAPIMVPQESATSARLPFFKSPRSSIIPALDAIPTKPPTVSKKSTKNTEKMGSSRESLMPLPDQAEKQPVQVTAFYRKSRKPPVGILQWDFPFPDL